MSLDNKQVRHLKVSSVSLWQVHWSVFHFKMSPFLQTGLKGRFLSVIFISPHSWHYTQNLAVVFEYSSASIRAGLVVSSSQTPVCVTVSVSDRSCASVDQMLVSGLQWEGSALLRVHVSKEGERVAGVVRFKVIGKKRKFSSWLVGLGIMWD